MHVRSIKIIYIQWITLPSKGLSAHVEWLTDNACRPYPHREDRDSMGQGKLMVVLSVREFWGSLPQLWELSELDVRFMYILDAGDYVHGGLWGLLCQHWHCSSLHRDLHPGHHCKWQFILLLLQCENTGDPFRNYENSQDLGYWMAVYWLLVTMSTVGFGEVHPSTDIGRAFVVIFIIGTFVSSISNSTLKPLHTTTKGIPTFCSLCKFSTENNCF